MIVLTKTPQETEDLARRLAGRLNGGEVILLHGDLGAGKTTFTKGLAAGLGISKPVTSPSFTLIKNYRGDRLALHHIDLYRLESEAETESLGIDELFEDDAVVVIEWNKYRAFPVPPVSVTIEGSGDEPRKITIEGIDESAFN